MDERTLNALKGSIAKWEAIVAGTEGDYGTKNCPLCKEFWMEDCAGCPIALKTGMSECDGTPYQEFTEGEWFNGIKADKPEKLRPARDMVDFLKSLLPEGA